MRLKDYQLKVTTIRDLIRQQGRLGERPFAMLGDDILTYGGADEGANRIANALLDMGVRKGDVVATFMYNSLDHILVWFGCAKIGAIWAPVNIALINQDLAHTIEDSRAVAIVIDDGLLPAYLNIRDRLSGERKEIVRGPAERTDMRPSLDHLKTFPASEPPCDVHWRDPAGIISTGGSTGLPKGVLVSNAWYFPGILRFKEMYRPTEDDVYLSVGQMYHTIGSAVDVLSPFYFGMTVVLQHWFSASRYWRLVEKHNATLTFLIGPALLSLMAQPQAATDSQNSLRVAGTATGGMPRAIVDGFAERFDVDLLEIYGQTETGPLGCISQRLDDRPYYSLGKPNGWAEVMISDQDGVACPPNAVGEILLRPIYPSTFMLGYHNRPEKFAESCADLWFHTGDRGHLDESGYLHFDGRLAHVIRRRGESISAIEVEEAVMAHPDIKRAAAVGIDSDMGDDDIKIYVELRQGAAIEPLEVIKFCEKRIAYFKVPRYIEFVSEFPVSSTKGEIERFKLKERGVGESWDREAAGYQVRRRA